MTILTPALLARVLELVERGLAIEQEPAVERDIVDELVGGLVHVRHTLVQEHSLGPGPGR